MVGLNLVLGSVFEKGRPGAVVRAVSLSHQVMGSKQSFRRFVGKGLPRFFSSPNPTHMGAFGTGSVLLFRLLVCDDDYCSSFRTFDFLIYKTINVFLTTNHMKGI